MILVLVRITPQADFHLCVEGVLSLTERMELAEALIEGVSSADVIINIVSRQRDPAPPITIMTPDALTLRHAPIADCARYDSLRRI